MGSTRFPGKSLQPIWGQKSLLEVVLTRVKRAKTLDLIVLATSDLSIDDVLVPIADSLDIPVFRGAEEDVLGRFCGALRSFPSDAIVRVCADNPLVDPIEIDNLVDFFWNNQPCDYACNDDKLDCGLPNGVGSEIFSATTLERLDGMVKGEMRGHVANYATLHPEEFRLGRLEAKGSLRRPEIKLDIDYPEDLEYIRSLIQRMEPQRAPYWTTAKIIEAVDENAFPAERNNGRKA